MLRYLDVVNNLEESLGFTTVIRDLLPEITFRGIRTDWPLLRRIAIACDNGYAHDLQSQFPDLSPATCEKVLDVITPNGVYW